MKDITLTDVLSDINLFEAWAKVKANKGCAGVDGESIEDFEQNLMKNLEKLRKEVLSGNYHPRPLLKVEIPKKTGGKRALSIPTVRDRILQSATAIALTPIFEAEFEDCSFAYRKNRSVDMAVARIERLRDEGFRWVVDADIDDFFDEIDHDLLMKEVKKLIKDKGILNLIWLWLNAEIMENGRRIKLKKGVPQGSPISPLLSNLYLDHLDEFFLNKNLKLVRYADDFVVLCKDKDVAEEALELTEKVLEAMRLSINEEKTQLVNFKKGFRFLGVQFIRSLAFKTKYSEKKGSIKPQPDKTLTNVKLDEETQPQKTLSDNATIMSEAFKDAGINRADFQAAPKVIESDHDIPVNHDPRLRTLYLLEHGLVLSRRSERFIIKRQGKILRELPAIKVDQIMIFGNAQITTQTMQFCLEARIPIFLLSGKGKYYGVIDSFDTDPVLLQRDQFARADDAQFCIELGRALVRGKIMNCRTILLRQARKRDAPALTKAAEKLKYVINKLNAADSLDQIRGFEGNAARIYFSAFAATLTSDWKFDGRNRQPPTDPVNSLLSYGYTLLFYNIYSFLRARGLNPHVGYLHPIRAGHPALVSDLIEEFRAIVVDAIVWALVLNRQVTPDSFIWPESAGSPCLIGDDARNRFIKRLENKLNTSLRHPVTGLRLDYRRCIEHQVNHLAAVIRGKEPVYRPMVLR